MVILLIGLMFFFRSQISTTQEKVETACVVSNYILLSYVTNIPEIQCSFNNNQERSCVDTSKLIIFNPEKQYGAYFRTNCKQKVYFTQLTPENMPDETCTSTNYPNCNKYIFYEPLDEYETSIPISTPVSLYNPITNEYQLGRLTIEILQ